MAVNMEPIAKGVSEAGKHVQGLLRESWNVAKGSASAVKEGLKAADGRITNYVAKNGGEDLSIKAYGRAAKHFAKNNPTQTAAIVGGTIIGSTVAATSVFGGNHRRYAEQQDTGRYR